MANDTPITIIGNLTADPELTQVGSNKVCNFNVASTPSTFDREKGEFVDKETIFMRVALWRDAAVNFVDSFKKGDRVIVVGTLRSNTYETQSGEKRVSIQVDATEVGGSVRYAKYNVTKTTRGNGGGNAPAQQSAPKDDTDGWGDSSSTTAVEAPF